MLNDLKSQLEHKVQAVRSLFERPIRVERGNVQLGTPEHQLKHQQKEQRLARVRAMQAALRELLDQHPNARKLMRHLALVEVTLRYQGLTAMQAMPVPVLSRALGQLERLVWDWSSVGLADLRSRLAVIVKNRPVPTAADAAAAAEGPPSIHPPHDIDKPSAADVTEVDHAAFEEMERSWAGQMPVQPAAPGA